MSNVAVATHSLYDIWESAFGNAKQEDIPADDAERIGRIIYMCMDRLTRAVSAYNFEIGHNDASTQCQRRYAKECADRAELIAAVESMIEVAFDRGRHDIVSTATDMQDEEAIEYLKASLENKEANAQA